MRLSFTKEYLINYIENVLIGKLYAEIQAYRMKLHADRYAYKNKLSKLDPDSEYDINWDKVFIRQNKYNITLIQDLLKTIKNADLLNPVVLENNEIGLLRL